MGEKKDLGPAKRFGARYGRTVKKRLAKIEREQKKKHKCPYCSKTQVKRVFAGVWYCRSCGAKFTSKAYTVTKNPLTLKKEKITEVSEEPTEQEIEELEVEE
ncbi:50S ribosomal protein L37ae [Candidatus Woesearchaeota archaeon]|nr:MAG: 50S ribosomal protein L37ae [Candidatus Woesearchaeota archaeon]